VYAWLVNRGPGEGQKGQKNRHEEWAIIVSDLREHGNHVGIPGLLDRVYPKGSRTSLQPRKMRMEVL